MEAYKDKNMSCIELKNTTIISSQLILFPTGFQVSPSDIGKFMIISGEFLKKIDTQSNNQIVITKVKKNLVTIKPSSGWTGFDFGEIWHYRDLLLLLIRRDFISQYKQTILGPLWCVLQPLFLTLVFSLVFGNFANISTESLPPLLFYNSGLLLWNFFQYVSIQTLVYFLPKQTFIKKSTIQDLLTLLQTVFQDCAHWQYNLYFSAVIS